MDLDFILKIGFLLSLIVGSFLNLSVKFGFIEWLQMRSPNVFFDKMLSCFFCMGHHLLFILTYSLIILGVIPYNEIGVYFIPLLFAPIVKNIV